MKKRLIKKSFKLASAILKEINQSKYSGFCSYKGICTKDSCKGCKYYKLNKEVRK